MNDHSIYLRVSDVYVHEITSGAAACALNATPYLYITWKVSSMVPGVTSVHVTL